MPLEIDAKFVTDTLKNILKVTNATFVNFKLEENILTLSGSLKQYSISYKVPVENKDNTSWEFKVNLPLMISTLDKKEKANLTVNQNTLIVKSGRSKADFLTNPYEEVAFQEHSEGMIAMPEEIKNYFFENFKKVNLISSTEIDTTIPLQMQIRENKIKTYVGEYYTQAFLKEELEGYSGEDMDFSIVLAYADLLNKVLPAKEKLSLYITPTTVEAVTETCRICLPRLSEKTIANIEQLETLIKETMIKDNYSGAISVSNREQFSKDLMELKTFFGNTRGGNIYIGRKDNETAKLWVETPNGKFTKALDYVTAADGEFVIGVKLDNLLTCVNSFKGDEAFKLYCYKTYTTLRPCKTKGLIYILSRMDTAGYAS